MIMPRLITSCAVVLCGMIGGILAFILTGVIICLLAVLIAWMTGGEAPEPAIMLLFAVAASIVTIPSGFLGASWAVERLLDRRAERRRQARGFPVIQGPD